MKLRGGYLSLSATDLAHFLACRRRAALELSVAYGERTRPVWDDPLLETLFAMGLQHEREYVESLSRQAGRIVDLRETIEPEVAVAGTLEAMRSGADVIVQASLTCDRWHGRPDVLMRVERPSPRFGDWSYEPADTKLARETRAGTILQVGLYCELLDAAQGIAPDRFHVVTPGHLDPDDPAGGPIVHTYRFHDFAAYFRLMKAKLLDAIARGPAALEAASYPDPVDHCDICPWIVGCDGRRRADDDLSLVAGISRLQRAELRDRGILTVTALGALAQPMPFKPTRGTVETYERVRDQARVQVRSRVEGRTAYELIPLPAPPPPRSVDVKGPDPVGLARLPAPSPGDVFFDLEGDALAEGGGREYLFGLVTVEPDGVVRYDRWWADDAAAERAAFEAVIDRIGTQLAAAPDAHVYHYAPYEPAAMKRLMGRYATRGRELDELLRGRRFVDLYAVVRQGVRAGVERYSIKNLEPLYEFSREVDLRRANRALRVMEQALEFDQLDVATPEVRATIEGYNRDDCVSTLRLRDWLEARRAGLVAGGVTIDRPPLVPGEASVALDEKAQTVEALRARLVAGIPDNPADRSADEEARYRLAYLLDWHRREDKAGWWEYFRLCELPEEDLLDEPRAVAGLRYVGDVGTRKKSTIQRYAFPAQECDLRLGEKLKMQNGNGFTDQIVAIDRPGLTIDIVVGPSKTAMRPTALFAHKQISASVIEDALLAVADRAAAAGGVAALAPCPERALLLRETPALRSSPFTPPVRDADTNVTDYAAAIVTDLDRTSLAIQGPPGSGKTFTGARMICALLNAGRRVGVTASGHAVIRHLLEAVAREAALAGIDVRLGHRRGGEDDEDGGSDRVVREFRSNEDALAALGSGEIQVLGGTAWLWARSEYAHTVDVLFVDEAGQMSLANTVAVARAASSVVLLGDPQQLEQPSKGSHPDGVGVSALQHVLGDAQTMPEEKGLFLPITWRLAPAICAFTSDVFYAGQLASKPGLDRQAIAGTGRFDGAGLWFAPVEHEGNRNSSVEEADEVRRIVERLLSADARWIDEHGRSRPLTPRDMLIVAPFNAHVQRLRETLDSAGLTDVPIGTVDKFQGQEAPVAIYSMATSSPDDAPRGMEFLYNLSRLNVATSRARCAAILVASPRLFEPECRTPRQMLLANALCRYRELCRS